MMWGQFRGPSWQGPLSMGMLGGRRADELRALIYRLFGEGQSGLAFFPQPVLKGKQTLYQGSDGTTLTDANGDPVGLGLEWSKSLELGPELEWDV